MPLSKVSGISLSTKSLTDIDDTTPSSGDILQYNGTKWTPISEITADSLKTARTIGISGGATGTATSFDGSKNITIPVTALDESKLSSAVAIARGGTGATTAAGALTNLGLTATATELNYCDGVTSAIQTQLNGKEASFTKNTAFNKNFGTSAGTVCEGNDSRLSDARTPKSHASTHGNNGTDRISIDASQVTTGVLDIARIPETAIQKMVTVENDTARFALTINDVQNGDSVFVTSTQKLYIVIDDTKLNQEAGYMQYRAYVSWDSIDNKPETFTPSVHASTHATGGTDAITPADIGAEPAFTKNSAFNRNFESNASNIKVAGTASVGSLFTIARADHVHPAQTTVSGNAGSATKLKNARTIGISGGATGTATSFDGSADITIPVTALDESKLSSAVAIARGGTGATTAAGALTNLGLTATATELNYCDGVTSAIQTQLNGKEASFTKNTAFNKNFETTASNYKVAGTAAVGSLSTVARADHVHPAQTTVSGNAGSATKLQTARTITLSGSVNGSASFDGSGDITITTTGSSEVITVNKSVLVTTTWKDTGIVGQDLDSGVYIVSVSGFTASSSLMSNAIFTGTMAWYDGITTEFGGDEIPLHKVGASLGENSIFLRTFRDVDSEVSLQICSKYDFTASNSLVFKFSKVI